MKVVTIGRDPNNDIVIEDKRVSRHHIQIVQHDDGTFWVADFGSANGTFVNGRKICREEIALRQDDIIRIGNTTLPWHRYFEIECPETVGAHGEDKCIVNGNEIGGKVSCENVVEDMDTDNGERVEENDVFDERDDNVKEFDPRLEEYKYLRNASLLVVCTLGLAALFSKNVRPLWMQNIFEGTSFMQYAGVAFVLKLLSVVCLGMFTAAIMFIVHFFKLIYYQIKINKLS